MYPAHDDYPGDGGPPWLNGRPATAAETPAVDRARQAQRDRDAALLAGVTTSPDRPGVVPVLAPGEVVTLDVAAAEGVL